MNLVSLSIFVILINLIHIFYTYSRTGDVLHYTNLFSLIFLITQLSHIENHKFPI